MFLGGGGPSRSHEQVYDGHLEENAHHLNPDLHRTNPDWLSLGPPDSDSRYGHQYSQDDPFETSRLIAPRTRDTVNYGTYEQGGPSLYHAAVEQGEGSSSHHVNNNIHSAMSTGEILYPGQSHYNHHMTTAFTQINSQELDTRRDKQVQEQSDEQYEDVKVSGYTLPNRKYQRKEWARSKSNLPVPLRLLSSRECMAIRVARSTPRHVISLYLEDRDLRSRGIHLGSIIPEPKDWQQHTRFSVLTTKPPAAGWNSNLGATQEYLDGLFQEAGLYDDIPVQKYTREQIDQEEMEKQQRRQQRKQKQQQIQHDNELYYRTYSAKNGVLIPLYLMATEDLTAMGLAKGHRKYELAKYMEYQFLKTAGCEDLLPIKELKTPRIPPDKFKRLLTDQYKVDQDSFLHIKQAQVQDWFIQAGCM